MRLALFDIDGTLIKTGHAGMRAFHRGLQQVFNLVLEDDAINPDGKTDPLIARECLVRFGLEHRWTPESREALFDSYLCCLEEEMEKAAADRSLVILPGVEMMLDTLSSRPDIAVGLVTGNLEQGARIKLGKAGLDKYFRFGGYGSDSEDRTALIRTAIERGTRLAAPQPVEASIVLGDTPLDIIHGHAAGALVVGVASARYTAGELRACSPDLLVPDLTHAEAILDFLFRP
jgi:phosphoglycolate phosphatase